MRRAPVFCLCQMFSVRAAEPEASTALKKARRRLHGRGHEGGTGALDDRDWGLSATVRPRLPLLAWLHVAAGDALRRAGRARVAGEAWVAARDRIPVELLTHFDMALTLAEQGAIEAGAIKSGKPIHQEQMAARDRTHAAEATMTQEYLRRSSELNREMAQRQRALDRFDRSGQQALREEFQGRRDELEARRDAEMRKLHGPGYR